MAHRGAVLPDVVQEAKTGREEPVLSLVLCFLTCSQTATPLKRSLMGIAREFANAWHRAVAHFVRIVKPPVSRAPAEWSRRLVKMKKCQRIEQLLREFGEPAHKVQQGEFEVWHYPLGIAGGFLYSIHVATKESQPLQIYMHMEPASQ